MTPDIDTSFTAPMESSNAYEPVMFNVDHGMCSGDSKKPETSGAAVNNDDKVLLCNNCAT